MKRQFQLTDVFSVAPFGGNPLLVVGEADDLSVDDMQRITRWMNHSEAAFLQKPSNPGADYRTRIFTLERELPFAGHPALGSCHVWLALGGKPKSEGHVVQECGVGLVRLRNDGGALSFAAPPLIRSGPVDEADIARIAAFLNIPRGAIVDAQWGANGPRWLIVLLESAAAVRALQPARNYHEPLDVGVVGLNGGGGAAYEIRAFFTDHNNAIVEDPATGSLNASAAQWLLKSGRVSAPYVVSQGAALGRTARVRITQDDAGQVWVGGNVATLFQGEADF